MSKKTQQMKELRDELWEFDVSPLYEYRKENGYHPVIGEGDHDADILFIGEAPGKNEAEQGRPFCGRSGKLLTELIESIGLTREEVYITNILKDRPPGNRDPKSEEIELYAPFLDRQVEIIEPKVVATLGRFSMEYMFKHFNAGDQLSSISEMHGKLFTVEAPFGEVKLMPLYHPAVALYNGSMKGTLLEDFEKLKKVIS
ncbi:MAG: uracil-DNA glycosylase [Candidatus Paceibacterota bacterium]